jgi:hypothetical protein
MKMHISRSDTEERKMIMENMDREMTIEGLFAGRYRFEKFMENDEIYDYVGGIKKLESDCVLASLTAGCLKIEAVFYRANHLQFPVYEVYVRPSETAEEWVCFDSPDIDVPMIDEHLAGYMFDALESVRLDYGLSYTDPDFGKLTGKDVPEADKPQENDGIGMA